jgi:hypothetical protein
LLEKPDLREKETRDGFMAACNQMRATTEIKDWLTDGTNVTRALIPDWMERLEGEALDPTSEYDRQELAVVHAALKRFISIIKSYGD